MKKKTVEIDYIILWGQIKVDGPVSISRADGQPLPDCVEEAQDYWNKNFASFLSLRVGKEVAFQPLSFTAFFKAAQKS